MCLTASNSKGGFMEVECNEQEATATMARNRYGRMKLDMLARWKHESVESSEGGMKYAREVDEFG
jgi:hypothetical protein